MDQHTKRYENPGFVALGLLALVRLYQVTFSMLVGRRCRHLPTCSDYAIEAIRQHGAWRGFMLGLFRLLRCHPWGTSGYDPVPLTVPANPFAIGKLWQAGKQPKDDQAARG